MKQIKRRNKLLTMNRLLQAAEEVIARRGVEKTSIRLISEQAEINKLLIYRYFSGWNGLIESLFRQILSRIDTRRPVVDEVASTTEDEARFWEQYATHFYRELKTNPAFQYLLRWQMDHGRTELGQRIGSLLDESINQVEPEMAGVETSVIRLLLAGVSHLLLRGDGQTDCDAIEQAIHRICSLFTKKESIAEPEL